MKFKSFNKDYLFNSMSTEKVHYAILQRNVVQNSCALLRTTPGNIKRPALLKLTFNLSV